MPKLFINNPLVLFQGIIRDDLYHNADGMQSPSWHEDVLRERKETLKLGADEFIDWELAKKNIRKEIE